MEVLLTDQHIHNLAPIDLPSHRTNRYTGQDVSVLLEKLPNEDITVIKRLYQQLLIIFDLLTEQRHNEALALEKLKEFVKQPEWRHLPLELRQLQIGNDSNLSTEVQQTLHDIRGGAFQALSVYLQLIELGFTKPEDITRIFLLTRDHLKIMRNCIPDLDPIRYRKDLEDKAHSIRLIVEKWSDITYSLPGTTAHVSLDCRYDGTVSERCIEFSAVDRVLYNFMNNATRNSADEHIKLIILPLPAEKPHHLRFVVANQVKPEQEALLQQRFGGSDLKRLFQGGFTTGGSGVGLSICAEFISNAYGIPDLQHALEQRYLGAECRDQQFVAWFHWPIVAD